MSAIKINGRNMKTIKCKQIWKREMPIPLRLWIKEI